MTAPSTPIDERVVDLQTHSTASDGALPPHRVIEHAAAIGLSAIALTDHDTMAGVGEAQATGARLGIRVIAGVELSAFFRKKEVHLLGLHIRDVVALEAELDTFRRARHERAVAMVKRLQDLGLAITMDDVTTESAGAAIGRPHVARVLVAKGLVRELREAFDKYLGAGRPAFVEKHPLDLADAIQMIQRAGGLAVWAHPGRDGTQDTVKPMAALGLDGIEVLHPGHSPDDSARLYGLAERHELLKSGGSDWHGQFEGPRQLGNQQVPYAWLEKQDARVAERAAAGAST